MARKKKQGERGYEKQEVLEAFMDSYRGQPCEVCGTTYGTCGHHYLGRGTCPRHIVSPENIITLCQGHHGPYGKKPNPHSGDPFLAQMFDDWVKTEKPDLYAWAEEHRNDTVQKTGKIDWLEIYEAL